MKHIYAILSDVCISSVYIAMDCVPESVQSAPSAPGLLSGLSVVFLSYLFTQNLLPAQTL